MSFVTKALHQSEVPAVANHYGETLTLPNPMRGSFHGISQHLWLAIVFIGLSGLVGWQGYTVWEGYQQSIAGSVIQETVPATPNAPDAQESLIKPKATTATISTETPDILVMSPEPKQEITAETPLPNKAVETENTLTPDVLFATPKFVPLTAADLGLSDQDLLLSQSEPEQLLQIEAAKQDPMGLAILDQVTRPTPKPVPLLMTKVSFDSPKTVLEKPNSKASSPTVAKTNANTKPTVIPVTKNVTPAVLTTSAPKLAPQSNPVAAKPKATKTKTSAFKPSAVNPSQDPYSNPKAFLAKVKALDNPQQRTVAIAQLNDAMLAHPGKPEYRIALAKLQIKANEPRKAIDTLSMLRLPEAIHLKALALEKDNQPQAAIDTYQSLYRTGALPAVGHIRLAVLLENQQQNKLATLHYLNFLKLQNSGKLADFAKKRLQSLQIQHQRGDPSG